jgi:hypothetical protein
MSESDKSDVSKTRDEAVHYLKATADELYGLSIYARNTLEELRFRLENPVTGIAAATLGMFLILASVLENFLSMFIPGTAFPVSIQIANLVAGVSIFLTTTIIEGIKNSIAITDVSRKTKEISEQTDEFSRKLRMQEMDIMRN